MEQRINEKFSEEIEKLDRLEKLMLDMNQDRRRVLPVSNQGGRRSSPSNSERRRDSSVSVRRDDGV